MKNISKRLFKVKVIGLLAVLSMLSACQATSTAVVAASQGLHAILKGINASEDKEEHTVVFLTRHAQKRSDQGKNPDLTDEGKNSAQRLATLLSEVDLDVVYSTPYKRTIQTATPTASQKKLMINQLMLTAPEMALKIRVKHEGDAVLVAGHSNTTPALLAQLGVENPIVIEHDQYGDLFVVVLKKGELQHFSVLKY